MALTNQEDRIVTAPIVGANYLTRALATTEVLAADARKHLAGVEFDTLVGIGVSGAVVVPRLAEALGVNWVVARKPNDGSHSSRPAEGRLGKRWVFVDDLRATGRTEQTVREQIAKVDYSSGGAPVETEYVGTYLYGGVRGLHDAGFQSAAVEVPA